MNLAISRLVALAVILATSLATATAVSAQNPFETVLRVNDRVVTAFDLQQRTLFLTLLNAGPDAANLAREQLISERLQLDAAQRDGISVPAEAVIDAQTEFAARGNFERDQFVQALGEQGVEEGTFRNFVEAGLVWREVVRSRFGPRVEVTDEEIDRALATIPSEGGLRVLVTEIILPAGTPETERASRARAQQLRQIRDFDVFANAARQFSISPSRNVGGDVGWRPVTALPEQAAAEIRGMAPGQVTSPVPFVNTLAIFQLRDREDVPQGSAQVVSADYAEYLIPGGQSAAAQAEAARVRREVRTCDDLYGVARGQPENRLTRQTLRLETLPADVSREIAGLDDNEVSTAITRGGNMVFLMLCRRTVRESGAVDRELVRRQLINQRLETFAAGYLNELRLAADIEPRQ